MPYPKNTDAEKVQTAAHLLMSMRGGAANDLATLQLQKLVAAVLETGKKGTVTIKIEIGKDKDADIEQKVKIEVKSSIPVADIPKGIYYPDEDGNMFRTDPRQMDLLEHKREDGDIERVGRGRVVNYKDEHVVGGTTIDSKHFRSS